MVFWQDINGQRNLLECLARPGDGPLIDLVRLKCIAAYEHEPAIFLLGDLTESADGIEPGLSIPFLNTFREEVFSCQSVVCRKRITGNILSSNCDRTYRNPLIELVVADIASFQQFAQFCVAASAQVIDKIN